MSPDKQPGRWFRRRSVWLPTCRGWLVLLGALVLFVWMLGRNVHGFLCVTDRAPGASLLVVEGWVADYALEAAAAELQQSGYTQLCVTGGPLECGSYLSDYGTFAELGRASLIAAGVDEGRLMAVPAPKVPRDRTYVSAAALRRHLETEGVTVEALNLVTVGAHARRSRLMFEEAFGEDVRVGVIAVPSQDYDARRWYGSSPGVRTTVSELIAYGYARVFFDADAVDALMDEKNSGSPGECSP